MSESIPSCQSVSLEEEALERVWQKYKKQPTESLRNTLATQYQFVVKYHAEKIIATLPQDTGIEVGDLAGVGFLGLIDAIESFDLEQGVKFQTYCASRVRGSMLDYLREIDWAPRLVRSRSKKVARFYQQFFVEYGEYPTEEEVRKGLNLSVSDWRKWKKDARAVSVESLHKQWFETDSGKYVEEAHRLPDATVLDPAHLARRKDLKELVTKTLDRCERLIIILYYYEEMTMAEIGVTIGFSESRISQIHASVLLKLRAQLHGRDEAE